MCECSRRSLHSTLLAALTEAVPQLKQISQQQFTVDSAAALQKQLSLHSA
jgi:hypothetical protein